jgi:hypothetical protein
MDNLKQHGLTPKNELNINPQDLSWVGCSKGTQVFESGYLFKRLPSLLSPTGKEEVLPAEVVICKQCGKIPKFVWDKMIDFPDELKSTCE